MLSHGDLGIQSIPLIVATKLFLSLGVGLLVGFEREWSRKDLGARTFSIVSILGMLTASESDHIVITGMIAVTLLAAIMMAGSIWIHRDFETTTAAALIATFILGVLVGKGQIFIPVSGAILVTLLLSMKAEISKLAGGVTAEEVRGAVLMGLIGFVIYPLLPDQSIDPWNLFNFREAWLTVILFAGISFINYVLLKLYSTKGLYYTAIFGGLVNSTATIAELATSINGPKGWPERLGISLTILTIISMFVRNFIILLAFSREAAAIAFWPILAMTACALAFALRKKEETGNVPEIGLSSPISIRKIASFTLIFMGIQAMGILGQRFFGAYGTVMVSFLGGFVSSASSTAAVGSLSAHNEVSANTGAIAAVLASISSAIVNIPIIYRITHDKDTVRKLVMISAAITLGGLVILGLVVWMGLPALISK